MEKELEDTYGESVATLADLRGDTLHRFTSNWWKDLRSLEGSEGEDWFKTEVLRKLGNGMETSFWNDRWKPERLLRDFFPRLYAITTNKNIKVGVLWNGSGEGTSFKIYLFYWRGKC